jgi:Transglutaminase-like superfamily
MSTRVSADISSRSSRLAWLFRLWLEFGQVVLVVRRRPLPGTVGSMGPARPHPDPLWLSRLVDRRLRLGSKRPRCLLRALVLARLLRRCGACAQVVIGLTPESSTKDAHAWVELDGADIGPWPGRTGHVELVRYG